MSGDLTHGNGPGLNMRDNFRDLEYGKYQLPLLPTN